MRTDAECRICDGSGWIIVAGGFGELHKDCPNKECRRGRVPPGSKYALVIPIHLEDYVLVDSLAGGFIASPAAGLQK